MEILLLAFGIAIGVGLLGVVAYLLYAPRRKRNKGARGRDNKASRVLGVAKRFASLNGYRYMETPALARNGRTAHVDALIIGFFGVLGVKALGYNGEIYGSAQDEQWLRISDDGTRTHFDNPLLEAATDVRVIRDALFAEKLKQVPVEVVCVFTDPSAKLALGRNSGHYTVKTFKNLLDKEKYQQDKGIDLDKVEKALKAAVSQ